jgi:cytoskeletal protein RodZ
MDALFHLAESWDDGTMSRPHRTRPARTLVLLATAVLAAVLAACGGEEPSTSQPAESASATPSESPSETTEATPSTEASPEPTKEPTKQPAGPSAEVTIEGGSVEPLAQSVEAEVGETVTLEITSDRAGELHVHSTPEQYREFGAGRSTVRMTFDKPGAVDVEEHDSGALVLRVLVQ